ncbi:hypothetical protein LCGC14_2876600, partial [marine sediment metagenome]
VAEHLVEEGYTNPAKLIARGGSMGGLLMGAVANMRPDLFRGIIAYVPWLVDVVGNPTAQEEVGDPDKEEHYWYMLSYSPYDNVQAKAYPHLLVTTGLHDSQVQYWEPAKWVARLRATRTDDNVLLLKTNMGAGHGGKSGRWNSLEETAEEFAFILWQMGLAA